jgi:DNA-binding SARP family transcriptional activator
MSTAPVEALDAPPTQRLHADLRLLGGFDLAIEGSAVGLPESSQRLVALVALNGRPMVRAEAAATLWPEKPEARAYANLRSSLWRLHELAEGQVVVADGPRLALDPAVRLDLARVEAVGWALTDGPAAAAALLQEADLFVLPLLPGWYEDWVVMERERLAQLQARFLESLVLTLVAASELTRALDYAVRLVRSDPLRERSQLCLLRVYAAEGSWGQLHGQLEAYEGLLRTTFGCEATTAFQAAVAELVTPVRAGCSARTTGTCG